MCVGDMTFMEAYTKTGRVLNIVLAQYTKAAAMRPHAAVCLCVVDLDC